MVCDCCTCGILLTARPDYTFNGFPDDVICDIAIYAADTTFCSKLDQVFDFWQQLELASELKSDDLQDTVDWGRKWLVDINAGKTQLVSFDCLITLVLLM